MRVGQTFTALLLLSALWGCGSPINKPAVLDASMLARTPLPADFLKPSAEGKRIVVPDTGWLADVNPQRTLATPATSRAGHHLDPGFELVHGGPYRHHER